MTLPSLEQRVRRAILDGCRRGVSARTQTFTDQLILVDLDSVVRHVIAECRRGTKALARAAREENGK